MPTNLDKILATTKTPRNPSNPPAKVLITFGKSERDQQLAIALHQTMQRNPGMPAATVAKSMMLLGILSVTEQDDSDNAPTTTDA